MPERDGYIAGVPCWIDTNQPDPEAAAKFYGSLFGWEFEDVSPDGLEVRYLIARIRGGDVAGIGSVPPGAPAGATWNTYVAVDSADGAADKVRRAGGTVLMEPGDVGESGRAAVFADPEGVVFQVWEARQHKGARIVNEHGSLNFNALQTRAPDAAKAFYGAVFGWQTLPMGGRGDAMWTLPGYGDHLERDRPALRQEMAELGAPPGFEDVVASLGPIADDQPGTQPHWSVVFAVDDADTTAAAADELGATIVVPPFDAPWVRSTVIADPQGAVFTASQFMLDNRDVGSPAAETANAA